MKQNESDTRKSVRQWFIPLCRKIPLFEMRLKLYELGCFSSVRILKAAFFVE
ncbi:hypothetical protein [Bartonella sp. MR63HLJHH]|uniref:hypothetical protein n=1 Tax=Bartonella sp. MR63HLJHH TaxID=3243558 RepID=UPI0035CF6D85